MKFGIFASTFCVLFFIGGFIISPPPAFAAANSNLDNTILNLSGFTALFGGYLRNPDNESFFPERSNELWGGDLRLLGDGVVSEDLSFEINLLQTVQSAQTISITRGVNLANEPERSSLFTWEQKDNQDVLAFLTLDVLQAKWATDRLDITVGRQPINLATTFFFTPNDFFAPFVAVAFFRVYKPGVDGFRAEYRIQELSQLSLIGVLGYEQEMVPDSGWSEEPDWSGSSLLARISASRYDFEWALLGGTVRDHTIIGGSLQGEVFDWLGVRAEGHYGSPEKDGENHYSELTVGLEHRFASSLDVRFEQFYHGSGYNSIAEANAALIAGSFTGGYLGSNYSALGIGYEFSPLLFGDTVFLYNWRDHSRLLALNLVYSVSDESELALGINIPYGDEPVMTEIRSEFGTLPQSISLEYRLFF